MNQIVFDIGSFNYQEKGISIICYWSFTTCRFIYRYIIHIGSKFGLWGFCIHM